MVNTKYKTTKDMIDKLQQLKCKSKLKFYKNKSNYYKEMKNINFQFQEDPFSRNAQGLVKYIMNNIINEISTDKATD